MFERSQPASQLARFRVIHATGRRRSGDRDKLERSQPASQLARFRMIHAKGRRRSSDRDKHARSSLFFQDIAAIRLTLSEGSLPSA